MAWPRWCWPWPWARRAPARSNRASVITTWPGSPEGRILLGHGAGRTKAEVEFRFVDAQTGSIVMVTADRRVAQRPRSPEHTRYSEDLLRESFDDMAATWRSSSIG
jgi:hypothetical protein